jgi:hypothetical protein
MELKNTSKLRVRVDGYGYVDPGASITVPDGVGRELCGKGSYFRATTAASTVRRKRAVKQQVTQGGDDA